MRAIQSVLKLVILVFIVRNSVTPLELFENIDLDILQPIKSSKDRIAEHGYPAESHYVETNDGYILNIFRLPYSPILQNQNEYRPAVLLLHGLTSNSDCWLVSGPNDSLAYNLADAGYDVWLGNARGNIYSRNNSRLSPKQSEFWQFSWHEIGVIDLSTTIDYIIEETGQNKINYVGHSQGTLVYLVLLSMIPEYNDKIKLGQLLAPCAYVADSVLLNIVAPLLGPPNSPGYRIFSNKEFFIKNTQFVRILNTICDFQNPRTALCGVVGAYFGINDPRKNVTAIDILLETNPAGASTNQLIHAAQIYISQNFQQYDFGEEKNIEIYDMPTPPEYDLGAITTPTYLYWGEADELCNGDGIDRLESEVPNIIDVFRVNDPEFDHGDFLVHNEVKELINDHVVRIFDENE